jgi:hypothetical protein
MMMVTFHRTCGKGILRAGTADQNGTPPPARRKLWHWLTRKTASGFQKNHLQWTGTGNPQVHRA